MTTISQSEETISPSLEALASKFARAVSYSALAMIVGRLNGVVVSVLMARYLGSSALGMYAILQSTIGLYSTFVGFGLGLTGAKMTAQFYLNDPKKAGRILSLLLIVLALSVPIVSGAYWWSLPLLAQHIYGIPELLPLFQYALLWLVAISISQFLESILAGLQAFKSLMIISFVCSSLALPLTLAALVLDTSNPLPNLVIAGTVVAITQLLVLLRATRLELKKHGLVLSCNQLRPLIRLILFDFTAPAFLGKLMEQPVSWLSVLLLVKLGGNLSVVGGLSVIHNLRTYGLYFSTMFVGVLVPLLSDIYGTHSIETFRRTLTLNRRFLWLTTFPVLLLLMTTVRPVLTWLFGSSFSSYWQAGAFLLSWAILIPINEVNDRAIIAMGKMWISLIFRFVFTILFLAGLWFLIPAYQLTGYVIAGGIAYSLYVAAQTRWLRSVTHERSGVTLMPLWFSIVCVAVAYSIAQIDGLEEIILYGFLRFICAVWVEWRWIVSQEEKLLVSKLIRSYFTRQETRTN
jgi:O-antigen/teichoic acid export membrane protein